MRPRAIKRSALDRPFVSARRISASVRGPTALVTRRSPRSLSGSSAEAGRRSIAGLSRLTALATTVAAASAAAALARDDGDGIGDAERERAAVEAGGRDAADAILGAEHDGAVEGRRRAGPRSRRRCRRQGAGRAPRWSAMSPPSLTKARSSGAAASMCREQLVGDAPATAAIGVTKRPREGTAGRDHAPGDGPFDARLLRDRAAQRGELVAQLRQDRPGSARRRPRRRAAGLGSPPGLQHDVDRPVRQVQAVAGELLHDGGGEHAPSPDLGERLAEARPPPRRVSGSSVRARDLGGDGLHALDGGPPRRRQRQRARARASLASADWRT